MTIRWIVHMLFEWEQKLDKTEFKNIFGSIEGKHLFQSYNGDILHFCNTLDYKNRDKLYSYLEKHYREFYGLDLNLDVEEKINV
jgi:hypothetical protein